MGKQELLGSVSNPVQPPPLDERFLGALYQGLSEAVFIVEPASRRVVYWNEGAEKLFQQPASEMLRQTSEGLFAERNAFECVVAPAEVKENGRRQLELECCRRDGTRFFAEVAAIPLRIERAAYAYLVVVVRDVSERREKERMILSLRGQLAHRSGAETPEQLKEKEHMATLGTATAMLAHEIRNPLNGMSTTVQFLERSLQKNLNPSKEMIVGTVQDLKNEIGRLQALLNDFHALSHPQQVQCQVVDLSELVRGLIVLLMPESLQEKVNIIEEFEPNVPLVSGDADKLKQVFLNLIKNSFEAMPRGGTLTARCYAEGKNACVEIADTGEGIPPDLKVFDLFRSTKPNGTGLGLAIARQIVQAHKGSIDYSSAPGVGTTFRVILPAKPACN